MKPVEQAIFASIETDRQSGYQVVARSAGVCNADISELAVWEPSRDSMHDTGPDAESFNFHPLPSGAYCLSRTTPTDWEHGSGLRIYTHCLIVPVEVLDRFANDPFALLRVISEHGLWQQPSDPCPPLTPFHLPAPGLPTSVDPALLNQLAVDLGPKKVATLVQEARDAVCLAVAGVYRPAALIAGLLSCLPAECRLDFSFSTGLKFSPRRPFRVVTISDDPAERLWVASYPNVTILDLSQDAMPRSTSGDGWSQLIERTMAGNHIPFLAAEIAKRRADLSLEDLPALGLQLLESLDSSPCCSDNEIPKVTEEARATVGGPAHAAHRQFAKSIAAAMARPTAGPSSNLGVDAPEVLEKLEHLDDLVYGAVSGQSHSLEQLRTMWPRLLKELGDQVLAESREQYLRYALSVWEECAEVDGIRNPTQANQALDVLCLLFDDAP
jgi:hypothetical protein